MSNPSGDSTITGLPVAATLQGTEFLVMDQVQGSTIITVKASVNQVVSQGIGALLGGTTGQMLVKQANGSVQFSNTATIIGSTIDNSTIGATTRSTGLFTSLGANGGLTVTGGGGSTIDSLTLGSPLVVGSGGTGRATLTNHAVLVGAVAAAVTQVAPSIAGQALISAGAAADPVFGRPTGVLIDVQVFTASGTWTKPTGCNSAYIQVIGGGGAGGGAPATTGTTNSVGGGGGGGGYSIKWITAGLGATETVTVGAGGTGVSGGTGNSGGNSSFGAHATGNGGGGGGVNGPANNTFGAGAGVGGGSSGGNFNSVGGPGHLGYTETFNTTGFGGSGGNSALGGGAINAGNSNNGNNASANTGGGGSGAANGVSQGAKTGGNGGSGVVIVSSYA